ncbi:MAG: hypothetical protein A4E65_00319 [Syntrophorhabdus sp. PtaU1.Bin153]|nr:MAG: hypothetical protein A4E65_00319 [Syntrophorhabdus sp. PtaU1.Bin153]
MSLIVPSGINIASNLRCISIFWEQIETLQRLSIPGEERQGMKEEVTQPSLGYNGKPELVLCKETSSCEAGKIRSFRVYRGILLDHNILIL